MIENISAELRTDNFVASSWLIYYKERKARLDRERQEILDASPVPQTDRVQGNNIGDSTPSKAEKLIKSTGYAQTWIWCVEACASTLGPKKRLILELVQEAATLPIAGGTKRWWVPWVQQQYYRRHGFWLPERSLHIYWDDIVDRCARIAAKKRIL